MRAIAALLAITMLAGCAGAIPAGHGPGAQPPPPPVAALPPHMERGPAVAALPVTPGDAQAALTAFAASCPALLARTDDSRLTTPEDWQPACTAAPVWPEGDARAFFMRYFEAVRVGDGKAFATGYYEPEIRASLTRAPGYEVPIYRLPPDLVRAWPADTPEDQRSSKPPLGRYDESGAFVPYYTRGEIEDGALAGRGLEIAWAADPVELFFLQVQGSGLLRLPDNSLMRIGYAGQNGREYVGIGSVMRQEGLIGDGPGQYPGSMQGIIAYIHDHPAAGDALMRKNQSWIFFRTLTTDGPLGSLGVPVRGHVSVAADPAYTPLGSPVWLDLDRSEADGLWIAQDTGGAIRGANRFDTFWGNGPQARDIAGGMVGRGQALVLLPRAAVERDLGAQ